MREVARNDKGLKGHEGNAALANEEKLKRRKIGGRDTTSNAKKC
jgi:hypothetical protein